MKKNQEEKARFYAEIDAACAAFSVRLEEMQDQQREREGAIEKPWLMARRRREWQRFLARSRVLGIVFTCFWGGTVANLPDIPPEVLWPPPHLTRMKEHHAEERKALREAHLTVVNELRVKHQIGASANEDGDVGVEAEAEHVCVERRLLAEVFGDGPIPSDDQDVPV
jgi:hypothetical protein